MFHLQEVSLSLGSESYWPSMTVMDASRSTADSLAMELIFEGLPRPEGQAAGAVLRFSWLSLPFALDTGQEASPEKFVYGLGDLGAVLAIQSRTETGFSVELYPMDGEIFEVDPGIVTSRYGSAGEEAVLTLTDQEGGLHEGRSAGLSPYGTTQYSRWEFGQLEPGEYPLHIPYLFLTAALPEDTEVPVLEGGSRVLELPGGPVSVEVSGEFPKNLEPYLEDGEDGARFFVSFQAQTGREELTLAGLTLSAKTRQSAPESFLGQWAACRVVADGTGAFVGLDVEFAREALSASPYLAAGPRNTITYRWEHSFELKIQVPS